MFLKSKLFNSLIVILPVFFFVLSASWIGFAVEVDWVSGDVVYSHLNQEWKELDSGMVLVNGDIIKTGVDGEATLIDQNSEIRILPNTKFTVSEKVENNRRRSAFLLFLGRIKFKLTRKTGVEPEIATQSVNLTIRGTEFDVASGHDGSTLVAIESGVVSVKGQKKVLVLNGGEGTQVDFGGEPEKKFKLISRVIDWDKWLAQSKEKIKGHEKELLSRILNKFKEIDGEIKNYESIRAKALAEKEKYVKLKKQEMGKGNVEEAEKYSKMASLKGKLAFHSIVSIRFLALSSIGLKDMADDVYGSIAKPEKETVAIYNNIEKIYSNIEKKYLRKGDRERLEGKTGKKGCLKLF